MVTVVSGRKDVCVCVCVCVVDEGNSYSRVVIIDDDTG